ncbi:MAG: hypothetical protein HQM15_10545 [Deltaproteobacteria bacterium]|nr:hypothetical protein [Deltaproteobacteria bacterium]
MKKALLSFATLGLLASSSIAHAIDFSAHGYYRLQGEYSNNLDLQSPSDIHQGTQGDNDRFRSITYGQQRFRIDPALKISDNISFHGQIDLLDNVIFGKSDTRQLTVYNPLAGTLSVPGASGAFGVTGGSGGDPTTGGGGNVNVRRLYVDLLTPMGKFRLGRQGSHWGLGILQNDGNDRDANFGDTFDRFLYIGKLDFKDGSDLAFATSIDFAYNSNNNPAMGGLERGTTGSAHDTYQFSQVLLYQRPTFEFGVVGGLRFRNGTGNFSAALDSTGATVPGAKDGDTRTYFIDAYSKWQHDWLTIKGEYVYLGGKFSPGICINGTQFPNTGTTISPFCLSDTKDLSVSMGALEAEAKFNQEEIKLISGYAQGDASPLSSKITQFGFRPDYHIGLMMFQMPLGTSPAIQVAGVTRAGNNPITSNYVNNAVYVGLTYKHRFDLADYIPQAQWLKLGAHVVTAWAPSRTFDYNFAELTGVGSLPHVYNDSRWYGVETDLLVEARFFDHVYWNLTGGVMLPGAAYNIKNDDLANASLTGSPMNSIIFDPANVAFAVRSTLMFEF